MQTHSNSSQSKKNKKQKQETKVINKVHTKNMNLAKVKKKSWLWYCGTVVLALKTHKKLLQFPHPSLPRVEFPNHLPTILSFFFRSFIQFMSHVIHPSTNKRNGQKSVRFCIPSSPRHHSSIHSTPITKIRNR